MDERTYCALETLRLKGKAAKEPLSRATYVRLYANKVKQKQVTHTCNLIKVKSFMKATK